MTSSAPSAAHPRSMDRLRADLAAADYTVPGIESRLGPVAAAALHREQAAPARRALGASSSSRPDSAAGRADLRRDPAAVLARLFLLGDLVPRRDLDRALSRTGTEGAERLGLVVAAGAGPDDPVRPLVELSPYAAEDAAGPIAWWLASDLGELATGHRLRHDHVLGAGGASLTLAQVTIRRPVGRALDLGTGCGIQALHAARHCAEVVGTDVSQRALAFAGFNAALAGTDLVLRRGSMLEPVRADEFDLVVSNPPFVITPRAAGLTEYEYRDGGRHGDDLVADLVRGVGAVLAPGGVAQLLANWELHGGQRWTDRVGGWLDESGLDGWVIQREELDPAEYAETWLRDGGTTPVREPEAWERGIDAWLDDFAARDVTAVGFGIVTLRRPAAGDARPRLRRLEEHLGPVRQPLGAHLAEALDAHDWLAARDDATLAGARLRVAPDVTEERYYTPGAADPNVVLLRQGGGLGRAVRASTGLAALVGACDGQLTVGQLTAAIAELFGVETDRLAAELLAQVRGLVGDCLLIPEG